MKAHQQLPAARAFALEAAAFALSEQHDKEASPGAGLALVPGSAGRFVALPALLRSAVFSARPGPRARFAEYVPLAAAAGAVIEFAGVELRQNDERALFALLHAARGTPGGHVQISSARAFARDALAWGDSGEAARAFVECLGRLQLARVRVIDARGSVLALSLVTEYKLDRRGSGWARLSPSIVEALAAGRTYIERAPRLAARDGFESWLLSYCAADAGFVKVPAVVLCELAGLGAAYKEDKAARRKLRAALSACHAHGGALLHYVDEVGRLCKTREA